MSLGCSCYDRTDLLIQIANCFRDSIKCSLKIWMFPTEVHPGSCSRLLSLSLTCRRTVRTLSESFSFAIPLGTWAVMEARGAPAEVLLQSPWLPVSIGGSQLLAKSWFGETAYHVLLTDMQCVWEESMDSAAIQKRAQVNWDLR